MVARADGADRARRPNPLPSNHGRGLRNRLTRGAPKWRPGFRRDTASSFAVDDAAFAQCGDIAFAVAERVGDEVDEAAILVRQLAAARKLSFADDSLDLFVLMTGGDRRIVASELEKLDLYLGPGEREVREEHVRLLVSMSREGIVWDLGTALSERNVRRALGLLDQLLFQGETAIGILIVAIIPTVRNLLLVKDLMARHRLSRPQLRDRHRLCPRRPRPAPKAARPPHALLDTARGATIPKIHR